MKILFIIYGSINQISGGYIYDKIVIDFLKAKGNTVDILELKKIPYLFSPVQVFNHRLMKLFLSRRKKIFYDRIIIDELTHPSVFLSVAFKRKNTPPVITLVHLLKYSEPIFSFLRIIALFIEKILLNCSDLIIVNSLSTAQIVKKTVRSKIPVQICKPGKNTFDEVKNHASRTKADEAFNKPVLLFVTANVIPRKGYDLLILALSKLLDLNWKLKIAGNEAVDKHYKKKIDKLILKSGMSDRVTFTGVLYGRTLARAYHECDIFVYPTRFEAYGISLAEAASFGLPYVAFRCGAIEEVVQKKGLLAGSGDVAGFRRHLRKLISDPEFRRNMADLSLEVSRSLPTWEETVECFGRCIENL